MNVTVIRKPLKNHRLTVEESGAVRIKIIEGTSTKDEEMIIGFFTYVAEEILRENGHELSERVHRGKYQKRNGKGGNICMSFNTNGNKYNEFFYLSHYKKLVL